MYSGDGIDIFNKFFGNKNPYTDNFEICSKEKLERELKNSEGLDDIVVNVACTIYEFYNGSLKHLDFVRYMLLPDGKTKQLTDQEMTVEVKAGYNPDTVLRFPQRGNQAEAARPSALQVRFELEDADKCSFKIRGHDLIYTHKISLVDAI